MSYTKLKKLIDSAMKQVPEVTDYCNRCLNTERWDGSVLLMVVDCSFTSIGLSYFHSVVPGVDLFRKQFLNTGKMSSLDDLPGADDNELRSLWKNRRSWQMAKAIASHFVLLKKKNNLNDRQTLRSWAKNSKLGGWESGPDSIPPV